MIYLATDNLIFPQPSAAHCECEELHMTHRPTAGWKKEEVRSIWDITHAVRHLKPLTGILFMFLNIYGNTSPRSGNMTFWIQTICCYSVFWMQCQVDLGEGIYIVIYYRLKLNCLWGVWCVFIVYPDTWPTAEVFLWFDLMYILIRREKG